MSLVLKLVLKQPRKKDHLSDSDFERHLKSPRGVFKEMKRWKQLALKKAAGLF